MSTNKHQIWLDCDPGHDDFFAINLAAHHPESRLLGISTVAGNQSIEKVTDNALNALHVMGLYDTPCVQGADHALMTNDVPFCPEIHGSSGLDTKCGFVWPTHNQVLEKEPAVVVMARTILAQPEKVHLVATGRLTNVALLFSVFPEVLRNILQVSVMGGAVKTGGNTHACAEFNIQLDPQAAQIVFNRGCNPNQLRAFYREYPHLQCRRLDAPPSYFTVKAQHQDQDLTIDQVVGPAVANADLRVPVVLVPLDVTHTVLANTDVLARVKAINSPYASLATDLFTFFSESYETVFKFNNGPPVHDPCAVLYCLHPELFTAQHYRADVECGAGFTTGQTVIDIWGQSSRQPNVLVTQTIDVPQFWNHMIAAIAKAAQASPLK